MVIETQVGDGRHVWPVGHQRPSSPHDHGPRHCPGGGQATSHKMAGLFL